MNKEERELDDEYYRMAKKDWFEEQEYLEELGEFGSSNTMMFYDMNRKVVIEHAKRENDVAKEVIKYYEQYIHRKDQWSFGLFRNRLIVLHAIGRWNYK